MVKKHIFIILPIIMYLIIGTVIAAEMNDAAISADNEMIEESFQSQSSTEPLDIIISSDKTGLKKDTVRYHLHHGDLFRYSESLTGGRCDNDGDYLQLIERIGDIYDSPEYIVLEKLFYEAIVAAVDKLPFKEKHIILGYYGLERYKNRFKEVAPLSKSDLAAHLHIGKVQSVDDNVRRAVKLLRTELEKQGWIEGEHTPKLYEPDEKDVPELADLDREIVNYAIKKWLKSGEMTEFHMLFSSEKYIGKRLILDFLKIWLY